MCVCVCVCVCVVCMHHAYVYACVHTCVTVCVVCSMYLYVCIMNVCVFIHTIHTFVPVKVLFVA